MPWNSSGKKLIRVFTKATPRTQIAGVANSTAAQEGVGMASSQATKPAKEMIRHHTDCNSMQKNSLKLFYLIAQTHYIQALINTINLSITCPRLAGPIAYFYKLGSANSGPVGIANHGWL